MMPPGMMGMNPHMNPHMMPPQMPMGMGMPMGMMPPMGGIPMGLPPGMQAPPGMGGQPNPPQPAPPASIKPEDDKMLWTEHTSPDGRKYYYNSSTKKSTYDKPDCMKEGAEKELSCDWQEFTSANKKKYYFNKKSNTSVWEEPEEFKVHKARLAVQGGALNLMAAGRGAEGAATNGITPLEMLKQKVAEQKQQQAAAAAAAGVDLSSSGASAEAESTTNAVPEETKVEAEAEAKAVEIEDAQTPAKTEVIEVEDPAPKKEYNLKFDSVAEAKECFKELLRESKMSSNSKWIDVVRSLSKDPRWDVLHTTGDKRQAFAEYRTTREKEEKEERRVHLKKARENFTKMLQGCSKLNARMRWREAEELFQDDERLDPVLEQRDCEDLYNEFIQELSKKEREARRKERKAKLEKFKELLETCESITHETRYKDLPEELEEDERYTELDQTDRRNVFEDYTKDLKRSNEDKLRKEMEEKRDLQKQLAADLRDLYEDMLNEEKITIHSKWKDVLPMLEEEEKYKIVKKNGGRPRDIFEDCVDDFYEDVRSDKKFVRNILEEAQFDMTHDHSFEDMFKVLDGFIEEPREVKQFEKMQENENRGLKFVFKEINYQLLKDHEKELKRDKMKEEDFIDLLEDYYYRSDHVGTEWSEAKESLKKHSAYKDLEAEQSQKIFDEYMKELGEKLQKVSSRQQKPTAAEAAPSGSAEEKVEEGSSTIVATEPSEDVAMVGAEGATDNDKDGEEGAIDGSDNEDGEEVDDDRERKKSKKEKKEKKKDKKSKKRKHKDKHESDSDSSDGEEDKSKKKKKSKRD